MEWTDRLLVVSVKGLAGKSGMKWQMWPDKSDISSKQGMSHRTIDA